MIRRAFTIVFAASAIASCASGPTTRGTLAELESVPPDIEDVYLEDSLERAAQSYRNYLNETPKSALTPEAMRRLADLQLEREYGVIAPDQVAAAAAREQSIEMSEHETVSVASLLDASVGGSKAKARVDDESEDAFESRATDMSESLAAPGVADELLLTHPVRVRSLVLAKM